MSGLKDFVQTTSPPAEATGGEKRPLPETLDSGTNAVDPEDMERLLAESSAFFGVLKQSIVFALVFFVFIAVLTVGFFFATRHLIDAPEKPQSGPPERPPEIAIRVGPDAAQVESKMYATLEVHPVRQLMMRIRNAIMAHKKRTLKVAAGVGVGLFLLVLLVTTIKNYLHPPPKSRGASRGNKAKPAPEPTPWYWWLGLSVIILGVVLFVGFLIYSRAYRNTSSSISIKYDGGKHTVRPTPGPSFATYQEVQDAFVGVAGVNLAASPGLKLFDEKSMEPIDLTAEVPPSMVPNLVMSYPQVVFELVNFVPADRKHKPKVTKDVPTGEAALDTLLLPTVDPTRLRSCLDERGKDHVHELKTKLPFTKLKTKFRLTTDFYVGQSVDGLQKAPVQEEPGMLAFDIPTPSCSSCHMPSCGSCHMPSCSSCATPSCDFGLPRPACMDRIPLLKRNFSTAFVTMEDLKQLLGAGDRTISCNGKALGDVARVPLREQVTIFTVTDKPNVPETPNATDKPSVPENPIPSGNPAPPDNPAPHDNPVPPDTK